MASSEDDWETESSDSFASSELAKGAQNLGLGTGCLNPVPSSVSQPDNALCETCKGLNLTPRQFVVLPGDKEYGKPNEPEQDGIPLGTVDEVSKKKHCPLCRLVLEALGGDRVPAFEDGEAVVIDLGWSTDGPRPDPSAPWSHVPTVRVLRPNMRKESGRFIHIEGLNIFPEITLVANDSPVPSATAFFARPIHPESIDFSLVRQWLSTCEKTHGEGCRVNEVITELGRSHPVEEVPEFRCIDVQTACLVKPPAGCQYAALSYVWGQKRFFTTLGENVHELEEPGAFEREKYRDEIPQTIKDAIHVTREVGIRYLWADSLCIVQDDVYETKTETIKKMDLVYSAANLVIIAAGSPDAHAGIPGVRPGTRGFQQPIEEIAPSFNLAFKTRWQDAMERTVHNTRGWTYQEMHFATRSLVFTGGQVTFRCQAISEWQEDIFEAEANLDGGGGRSSGPFHGDDVGEFEGLIQTYSGKVLTYNADIYNGFAGVAQQLAYRLETDLCHGTPTAYFDWFLLWGPLADQTRRLSDVKDGEKQHPIAPSWSWAGWVGSSFPRIWDWYNRSIRRVKKAIAQRTWIIWYHRESHDSEHVSLIWRHSRLASKAKNLNFYGVHMKKRFKMDCSRTQPTARTLVKNNPPEYAFDILSSEPGSGFLQFWTVSMKLRLGEPTSDTEDLGPAHTRRRLGIFGRSGQELGTIQVPGWWAERELMAQECEFILICEGRDQRAENGRIDDDEGWRYMAMLIEWHGEYAERVALGSIGKGDLDEAFGGGAVWKEIILG